MFRIILIGAMAFLVPIGGVACWKWDDVRPYVVGDPDLAQGTMYYFAAYG